MTAEDVLDVLERLDTAAIEWWIVGGWGVDALLGEQTRAHADLDLAVRREQIDRLPAVFPEFRHVHKEEWPSAFVLHDEAGRRLDFHPLEFDERGDGWWAGMDGRSHRWPCEALAARGRIAGREVRCTSVAFQLESHLYAGYDDVDWSDIRALCDRFAVEPAAEPRWPGFVHSKRSRLGDLAQ